MKKYEKNMWRRKGITYKDKGIRHKESWSLQNKGLLPSIFMLLFSTTEFISRGVILDWNFFCCCIDVKTHENKKSNWFFKTVHRVSVQNRQKKLNSILLFSEQNRTENFLLTLHIWCMRACSEAFLFRSVPFRSCPQKVFYKWKFALNVS